MLPITVQHDKKIILSLSSGTSAVQQKGQGMAFRRPILLIRLKGLPEYFFGIGAPCGEIDVPEEVFAAEDCVIFPQLQAFFKESQQVGILFGK